MLLVTNSQELVFSNGRKHKKQQTLKSHSSAFQPPMIPPQHHWKNKHVHSKIKLEVLLCTQVLPLDAYLMD